MQAVLPSFSPPAAHPALECAHCGSPVENSEQDGPLPFCCQGCRTIHSAIHAAGLQAFYEGRDRPGTAPPRKASQGYQELDGPGVEQREYPDGTRAAQLFIEGIHCASCVWLLESLPKACRGVRAARLDFGRSLLDVRWDPAKTTLAAIARAVDGLGYVPHVSGAQHETGGVERSLMLRLGVAGAIAGNVMLMAFSLYSGADSALDGQYARLFRWASFGLALPSVAYCALPFYRGAWAALRARTASMDLPIAVGISVGFSSGAVNTLRGDGEIYFDTITTLIFLLLVGRWLTARQHRRAATTVDFTRALAPSTARVLKDGEMREIRAEAVDPGNLVEVRAGERVPVDGRVERGESSVDVRLLTGESSAQDVKAGDRVYAGTDNLAGSLVVRAERTGASTRIGQLIEAMERAHRERAPIVKAADRIAGRFVLAVLALAVVTLGLWWSTDPALALNHAVALLVVTCPCALGMATPLAVSVALSRAARRGILLKNGEVLEALARPAELLFDKSGTLTAGRPEVVIWQGTDAVGRRVSRAEKGCDHPLARAFQRAFPEAPRDADTADSVERFTGAGLRAHVDGKILVVGKPALLTSLGIDVPSAFATAALAHAGSGLTPVLIAEDGEVVALAAFGDALRSDADTSLRSLKELGYPITVLSGDHPLVVERVCRTLPVLVSQGGMTPEQKLAAVTSRIRDGRSVVMVGDGVNDAAAMSAATVGFAVHGGAEASLLAAGGFATEPGVRPVLEAIVGARHTLRVIHRGIAFSLAYNAVGVALAMGGLLSPLWAAVLMPLSSLTVVTSALRSRAFQYPALQENASS